MEMYSYLYRKPSYLPPINKNDITDIVIHHTGNNNYIDTNTDYHMDHNGWSWLGYAFYIVDGVIFKVRGCNFKNAAVKDNNHYTLNIAVQGNYDNKIPDEKDIIALQELIYYLKEYELSNVKIIKPHSYYNDTSCCGKFFPWKTLKLKGPSVAKYATVEEVEEIRKELQYMKNFLAKNHDIRIR